MSEFTRHTVTEAPIRRAFDEWLAKAAPSQNLRDAFEAGYHAGIRYAVVAMTDDADEAQSDDEVSK
jgi:hypothetical protein